MDLRLFGRPEKKNKIKGDRVKLAKNPLMLKLVFLSRTQESQLLEVVETYLHLICMSPFIVSFGAVTCLITSSTWMEVGRFQCYLVQLLLKLESSDLSSITAIRS